MLRTISLLLSPQTVSVAITYIGEFTSSALGCRSCCCSTSNISFDIVSQNYSLQSPTISSPPSPKPTLVSCTSWFVLNEEEIYLCLYTFYYKSNSLSLLLLLLFHKEPDDLSWALASTNHFPYHCETALDVVVLMLSETALLIPIAFLFTVANDQSDPQSSKLSLWYRAAVLVQIFWIQLTHLSIHFCHLFI